MFASRRLPAAIKTADGVENDHFRFESLDQFVDGRKVHFQAVKRGTAGVKIQQVLLHPRRQV